MLLTHAHRDACGGLPRLRGWLGARGLGPVTGELELHAPAPTREEAFAEATAAVLGELLGEPESVEWVEPIAKVAVGDTVAAGTVVARRGRPAGLVKAVTYPGLSCEPDAHGWRATVVRDV